LPTSTTSQTGKMTKQQHPVKQTEPKKRKLKILLSILLGILLMLSIFLGNATKLYEKYFVNGHQEVVTYLEKIDRYKNASTENLESIRLKLYRTDLGEYSSDVKMARADLQQVIDQTVALTPPKGYSR
jgi:hypothetical protein